MWCLLEKLMVCVFGPSLYHTSKERWHRAVGWKSGEFFRHGIATDHPVANFLLFKVSPEMVFGHLSIQLWRTPKDFCALSPVTVPGWDFGDGTSVLGFVTDLLCDTSSAKHQMADPEDCDTHLSWVLLTRGVSCVSTNVVLSLSGHRKGSQRWAGTISAK